MAQSEIQVTTTPPLPGTQLVQEINDALETIATDFSGAIDPAANAFAYSLWADTGTGDLKRRNAANSAWITIGRIYPAIVENSSGQLVNPAYTGTLTGGTGVINIGSGQVYKDASGNLGLGVTPSAWISAFKAMEFTSAGSVSAIVNEIGLNANSVYLNGTNWTYKATDYASQYRQSNGQHIWYTAPSGTAGNAISFTQVMTLDADGALLINTTTRLYSAITTIRSTDGYTLTSARTGTGSEGHFVFENGNGAVGTIFTSGTGTSYNTSSDYRLKEITGALTGAEAKDFIMALQPKQGAWKADGSKFVGFLAHEFQAISPSSVSGEKDAVDEDGKPIYQGMQAASSEVMANLIALVQEQQALIQQLQADVAALKA